MSKQISPTLIGGFVVGALALLIVAVVAFGSGQLFRKTQEFILYFDGSVNGLRIGAPVKFKGVEIGSVKDIKLETGLGQEVRKIPVIVEIDLKKVIRRGVARERAMDPNTMKEFVQQGLRGQLQTESLVTGVLYVALDWFPETPLIFIQPAGEDFHYAEIPTVPTELEQFQANATRIIKKLEAIDLQRLADSLTKASDGVGQLADSPALKSALKSLDRTIPEVREAISDFRRLTNTANNRVNTVSDDFHDMSTDLRKTVTVAQTSIEQFAVTMKEAQETIISVRATVDPDSPIFYELTRSLREISGAARSLRTLANNLDRNPQSLISGNPENGEIK